MPVEFEVDRTFLKIIFDGYVRRRDLGLERKDQLDINSQRFDLIINMMSKFKVNTGDLVPYLRENSRQLRGLSGDQIYTAALEFLCGYLAGEDLDRDIRQALYKHPVVGERLSAILDEK